MSNKYRCYNCQQEINNGFYWEPLPRVGSYAMICIACHKAAIIEAKQKRTVEA